MTGFLLPALELMVILPGMLLAYLPMKGYLRLPPAKLAAATVALTLSLCLAGGAVNFFFHAGTLRLLFPAAAVMGFFYVHTLKITRWKSVSVFLAICGAFSCLGSAAVAVTGAAPLSLRGVLLWLLMCCLSVPAVWHPATHAARRLLEDKSFAQTWYVFWILPILFTGLNLLLLPEDPDILGLGRLRRLYLLLSLAFLLLLLLFYALFYLMASSLNRNDRLRRENQLLSMQQARYDSLRVTIGQIRQARHDMRHHFHILQGFAAQENWARLAAYLDEVQGGIPEGDLGLCENATVDSVAGYFAMFFRERGVPVTFSLDIHSGHMVLLSVENAYDGEVREKDGILLSSKRLGEGVGLQSVRHTAEKNGGYSRFHYGDGIFTANVILRAGHKNETGK